MATEEGQVSFKKEIRRVVRHSLLIAPIYGDHGCVVGEALLRVLDMVLHKDGAYVECENVIRSLNKKCKG